jgi:hypothetical protein
MTIISPSSEVCPSLVGPPPRRRPANGVIRTCLWESDDPGLRKPEEADDFSGIDIDTDAEAEECTEAAGTKAAADAESVGTGTVCNGLLHHLYA